MPASAQNSPDLTRLRQAVDASGEVIFMTDTTGVFTFVNPQFERLYGHRASDIVGHATPRLLKGGGVPPEQYAGFWRRLLAGQSVEGEFTNRTKDGRLVNIEATVSPIWDDHRAIVGFLAIQRDITARKLAEETLRQSQARLQLISDNVQDLVAQIRLDGTFLYVSPSFTTILGYAPSALVGTSALAPVHPEDLERVTATLMDTIARQGTARADYRYRRADGSYAWLETVGTVLFDADRAPYAAVLSTRDISERKRSEEALRDYDRRLQIAMASAHIAVFGQDRDLRYTWLHNPQLGIPTNDVIGRTDAEVFPPESAAQITEVKRRALESGERVREEVRVVLDGQTRFFELVVEPLRSAEGRTEGITGAWVDTTTRRRLEDQLRQAQKLEAIGSLAGGIAHDFNNLLTAILGYTDLALAELDPDSPIRSDLEEVSRAGHSAESLTRQLLIFSRKSVVQPVVLRLNDVVARVDKMLRRVVGEHITFDVRLGTDLGLVKVDPIQLEQVLMNLAVNARDAMPMGGVLTIETGHVELDDATARSRGRQSGGTFDSLSVTDTGHGMAPEVLSQIFDPFFTTKSPDKGTGLGLATVHGIVEEAGGLVTVDSVLGRGSTFTVCLPRVPAQDDRDTSPSASRGLHAGTEAILFVEDEESIRTLVVRALRRYGYDVRAAASAPEALELAADSGTIDLLITDIVMPGINGRTLADRLRRARPHLKVIFTSGFADDSEIMQGVRRADTTFLQKPYATEALARTVRSVLDRA